MKNTRFPACLAVLFFCIGTVCAEADLVEVWNNALGKRTAADRDEVDFVEIWNNAFGAQTTRDGERAFLQFMLQLQADLTDEVLSKDPEWRELAQEVSNQKEAIDAEEARLLREKPEYRELQESRRKYKEFTKNDERLKEVDTLRRQIRQMSQKLEREPELVALRKKYRETYAKFDARSAYLTHNSPAPAAVRTREVIRFIEEHSAHRFTVGRYQTRLDIFKGIFHNLGNAVWQGDYAQGVTIFLCNELKKENPDVSDYHILGVAGTMAGARFDYKKEIPGENPLPNVIDETYRSLEQYWQDNKKQNRSVHQIRQALTGLKTPSWTRMTLIILMRNLTPNDQVRVNRNKLVLSEVMKMADAGLEKGEGGVHLYNYFFNSVMDAKTDWAEFEQRLKPDADPWLKAMVSAQAAQRRGWAARGGGFADTVSRKSFEVFREELGKARELYYQALKLYPERPNPYICLIDIEKCLNNVETRIDVFKKLAHSHPDIRPAYYELLWAILPRWGGSLDLMMAFGDECVNTGRNDTIIPVWGFDFYGHTAWDSDDWGWKKFYLRDEMIPKIDKLFADRMELTEKGYQPGYDYCLMNRILYEAATLRYDKAAATIKEFGGIAKAREYFSKELQWHSLSFSKFYPRMPQLYDALTEIEIATGPAGEKYRQAEAKYLDGDLDAGNALLAGLIKDGGFDTSQKQFLIDLWGRWNIACTPARYVGSTAGNFLKAYQVAGREGREDIARQMQALGFIVQASENYPGETAIAAAQSGTDPAVLDILRDNGDPLDRVDEKYGRTPLHHACMRGNTPMVRKLIELKLPLETLDKAGHAPIHLAATSGSYDATELLIKAGVNPDRQDRDGDTALMFVLQTKGSPALRRLLIKHSKDINLANNGGRSALHYAVQYEEDPASVSDLIAAGAKPDQKDKSGVSPRDLAKSMNKDKFLQAMP